MNKRQLLFLLAGAGAVAAMPPAGLFLGGRLRKAGYCLGGDAAVAQDLALLPRLGFSEEMEDFIAFAEGRYDRLCFLDTSHSTALTRLALLSKKSLHVLARHSFESLLIEEDHENDIFEKLREGKITQDEFMARYDAGTWSDVRVAYAEALLMAQALQDPSLPGIIPVDARQDGKGKKRELPTIKPEQLKNITAAVEALFYLLERDAFINTLTLSCKSNWHDIEKHADAVFADFLQRAGTFSREDSEAILKAAKLIAYDRIYGKDEETAKVIEERSPPHSGDANYDGKGSAIYFGAGHFGEYSRLIADEPSLLEHLEDAGTRPILIALYVDATERDSDYVYKAFIHALLQEDYMSEDIFRDLKDKAVRGEINTEPYPVEFLMHPDRMELRINDAKIKEAFEAWRVQHGRQPGQPRGQPSPQTQPDRAPR